jgi:hypothetical protein
MAKQERIGDPETRAGSGPSIDRNDEVQRMRRVRLLFGRTTVAVLLALLVAACGSSTSPDTVENVDNNADNFSFDLSQQADFSGTLRYLWSNSGATATINLSAVPTGGIGTLSIQDADSKQVFTGSVLEAGTFTTDTGRPGSWTVTVLLVRIEGRLTFRLQKS